MANAQFRTVEKIQQLAAAEAAMVAGPQTVAGIMQVCGVGDKQARRYLFEDLPQLGVKVLDDKTPGMTQPATFWIADVSTCRFNHQQGKRRKKG